MATRSSGGRSGRVESIVDAVEVLSPDAVSGLASQAEVFEFFERGKTWDAAPERFRLHAVAVQRAADRLAAQSNYPHRDRLLVTALLHDIGKLVLMHAYPGYPRQVHGPARTPEERLHYERRELGVDHALVGGVLARRWNLPRAVASAIERHHAEDAEGDAAYVRLADMVAHYAQGAAVNPNELLRAARRSASAPPSCAPCSTTFPTRATSAPARSSPARSPTASRKSSSASPRAWSTSRSPTSSRLSTSTVRTHLHNIYGKLGAVDRAQAVLIATERGWL